MKAAVLSIWWEIGIYVAGLLALDWVSWLTPATAASENLRKDVQERAVVRLLKKTVLAHLVSAK